MFVPLRRVFPGGYKCNKAQDGKLSWKLVFMYYRVKWGNSERMGNLERPCKSSTSVNGKLQVKFSVCNVLVN